MKRNTTLGGHLGTKACTFMSYQLILLCGLCRLEPTSHKKSRCLYRGWVHTHWCSWPCTNQWHVIDSIWELPLGRHCWHKGTHGINTWNQQPQLLLNTTNQGSFCHHSTFWRVGSPISTEFTYSKQNEVCAMSQYVKNQHVHAFIGMLVNLKHYIIDFFLVNMRTRFSTFNL
jgi:hypothetical protein